jgi:homeobox-leucine zipper protein
LAQFLEVVRIEDHAFSPEDASLACDMYLLHVKLCACLVQFFVFLNFLGLESFRQMILNCETYCSSAVELMKVQLEHVLNLCLHLFDESFADDALLVPSGFRVIPLDPKSVSIIVLVIVGHRDIIDRVYNSIVELLLLMNMFIC